MSPVGAAAWCLVKPSSTTHRHTPISFFLTACKQYPYIRQKLNGASAARLQPRSVRPPRSRAGFRESAKKIGTGPVEVVKTHRSRCWTADCAPSTACGGHRSACSTIRVAPFPRLPAPNRRRRLRRPAETSAEPWPDPVDRAPIAPAERPLDIRRRLISLDFLALLQTMRQPFRGSTPWRRSAQPTNGDERRVSCRMRSRHRPAGVTPPFQASAPSNPVRIA